MLLCKFRSQPCVVGFALRCAQVCFNLRARIINVGRRLIGGTQRRVKAVTLRVTPERIHTVELVFSLSPSNQPLLSLYPDPPILTPLSNDFGSTVPQTACVVHLCNSIPLVFS